MSGNSNSGTLQVHDGNHPNGCLLFDFSNYSSKILQRVNQKQHPCQNVPREENKDSLKEPPISTSTKLICTADKSSGTKSETSRFNSGQVG